MAMNISFRLKYVSFGALFFMGFSLQSQVRKYSNDFLSIGVGAKGLGMSGAIAASSDQVASAFWNPAGLINMKPDVQVSGMHAEYFAGISKLDYGAVGFHPDTSSAMAFSLIRLGIDDIPNTIDLVDENGNVNYDNVTSFSAADYAFLFSYARKLKIPNLTLGGNGKVIHRKVGSFAQAWGFGLDLGLSYRYKAWTFAFVGKDITTTVNAWSFDLTDRMKEVFVLTGNEIPENSTEITAPKFVLAAAHQFVVKNKFYFTPELDIDITTDGQRNVLISGKPFSVDPHIGIESSYKKMIFLRLGLGNIQKEKNDIGNRYYTTIQPNAGIGFKWKNISLDYALTDIGDQSAGLYSHVFSLTLDIYKGLQVSRVD